MSYGCQILSYVASHTFIMIDILYEQIKLLKSIFQKTISAYDTRCM